MVLTANRAKKSQSSNVACAGASASVRRAMAKKGRRSTTVQARMNGLRRRRRWSAGATRIGGRKEPNATTAGMRPSATFEAVRW